MPDDYSVAAWSERPLDASDPFRSVVHLPLFSLVRILGVIRFLVRLIMMTRSNEIDLRC